MNTQANNVRIVSQNYRGLGSTKPLGDYDLEKNEEVEIIAYPSMGSIPVQKKDGTTVNIDRISSFILKEKEY